MKILSNEGDKRTASAHLVRPVVLGVETCYKIFGATYPRVLPRLLIEAFFSAYIPDQTEGPVDTGSAEDEDYNVWLHPETSMDPEKQGVVQR